MRNFRYHLQLIAILLALFLQLTLASACRNAAPINQGGESAVNKKRQDKAYEDKQNADTSAEVEAEERQFESETSRDFAEKAGARKRQKKERHEDMLLRHLYETSNADDEDEVKESSKLTVVMAHEFKTLDPFKQNDLSSANINMQIYETLIELDGEGNIVESAGLADEIAFEDNLLCKVKLKPDILFHNGDFLQSSDAVFSLKMAAKSPQLQHIFGIIDTSSFLIEDELNFSFRLKIPYAGFLKSLAHPGAVIVNEKAYERMQERMSKRCECGTGPYVLISASNSEGVILERFPHSRKGPAAIKIIEFRSIPDHKARMQALKKHEADLAYDVPLDYYGEIEKDKELQLIKSSDNSIQYLGMNCAKPPFDDIRVRKALAMAINKRELLRSVNKDEASAATAPVAPNIKYSLALEAEIGEYNPEKARKLLREAGYKKGFACTLSTNARSERITMAEEIKKQLAENLDIDLQIEILPWQEYIDKLSSGRHQLFELAWNPVTPDADAALYAAFSSSSAGPGGNFAFYSNPAVDKLLLRGRLLPDGQDREEIYRNIQEIIIDEQPWIFQYYQEATAAARMNLTNLKLNPYGFYPLYNLDFKD